MIGISNIASINVFPGKRNRENIYPVGTAKITLKIAVNRQERKVSLIE